MAFKGHIPWNKGLKAKEPRSLEVRARISETNKKKGVGKWMNGRKLSEETKKKVSVANTGKKRPWVKGWSKGKPRSPETRKKLSGANNHWWKGGIHPVVLQIRNLFEYRQWRSDVFTRDDFTCQFCSMRGGVLNADHYPKSFATILAENEITTIGAALNCSELWDINNGRTLCLPCHRTTETWGTRINRKI